MNYILKHNDVDVAELELNIDYAVTNLTKIYNPNHLPILLKNKDNLINIDFNDWLQNRYISPSRKGVKELLQYLKLDSPIKLLIENHALSLTDHYWLCGKNEKLSWKDVNYFENSFDETTGEFLLGNYNKYIKGQKTPEIASRGSLVKKWHIEDDKRLLIKGGAPFYYQEPANEIIASKIMDHLAIEHTAYRPFQTNGNIYSSCENYLGMVNEEIPAYQVIGEYLKNESISDYSHYLKYLDNIGLTDTAKTTDKMITIDYLIGNTDRHLENFGVMRNADTLAYAGIIPIFDCGNSLQHTIPTADIDFKEDIFAIYFDNPQSKNIMNVTDFEWLNRKQLKFIPQIAFEALKDFPHIPSDRKNVLCDLLACRVESLTNIIEKTQKPVYTKTPP
jgi:hypothetical protein